MHLPNLPALDAPSLGGPLPLWPPLIATSGRSSATSLHAHHGMHFVLSRSGSLRVRFDRSEPEVETPGLLTAPDVAHAIEGDGEEVLIVFLDPESGLGSGLCAAMTGPAYLFDEAQRGRLVDGFDPLVVMGDAGTQWVGKAAAMLGLGAPTAKVRPIHPAVRRVLELLESRSFVATDLESLAASVDLSPGRLMHAFTESIGIPLRPYLAWLKLQRACAGIQFGMSLSDAALSGGFSDAAHLTRTMRKMLGVTPSQVRSRHSGTDDES